MTHLSGIRVVEFSRGRLLVLLLIAAHLTALVVGSIPPPNQLSDPACPEARGVEPISAWLTPRLDAVAAAAARVHRTLWNVTSPLRPIVSRYLSATGLDQRWAMFWNPSLSDEDIRVIEATCELDVSTALVRRWSENFAGVDPAPVPGNSRVLDRHSDARRIQ